MTRTVDRETPATRNSPWDVLGIIWRVDSYLDNGHLLDASLFGPLALVFTDSTSFEGRADCNHFWGEYSYEAGIVRPTEFRITTVGCRPRATFRTEHLGRPFGLETINDLMILETNGGYIYYHSNFLEPVLGTPLSNAEWRLSFSTEVDVNQLDSHLVPVLRLGDDRTYTITWDCGSHNEFGCSTFSGFWGLGAARMIEFFPLAARVMGTTPDYVGDMQRTEFYTFRDDTLVLYHPFFRGAFSFVRE